MGLRERLDEYRARSAMAGAGRCPPELLSTVMENIDLGEALQRLGVDARPSGNGEWCGFCPDHELFKGVPPSHPKWYINERTGICYCHTESRASNLVETARRLIGCRSNEEAAEFLLGGRPIEVRFKPARREDAISEEASQAEKAKALARSIKSMIPVIASGSLSRQCIEFFARDGITIDTLEQYGVCSCESGRYSGRAVVPFIDGNEELCGFVAVDYLGRDRRAEMMARRHFRLDDSVPLDRLVEMYKSDYRKALYAPGFQGHCHIYGFHENQDLLSKPHNSLVVVEGERDCLKLNQEGVPCISIHGTCLKDGQRVMLKSSGLLDKVDLYLGFDMDSAGDKAVEKCMEVLSGEMDADRIYVLNFPDGKDPKKFARKELVGLMMHSKRNRIRQRMH